MSRETFIDGCKKRVAGLWRYPHIVRYKRNSRGERLGVTVACIDCNGRLWVGASKCRKGDKFDRHIGICYAISRAVPLPKAMLKPESLEQTPVPALLLMAAPLSMHQHVADTLRVVANRKSFNI